MEESAKNQFCQLCNQIQRIIYSNKENKGFNISDVPLEFCYTNGELAEAFDAWRKKKEDVGEELADVAIYLFGLASILNIDLGKEITYKIDKNQKREYRKDNGILLKK